MFNTFKNITGIVSLESLSLPGKKIAELRDLLPENCLLNIEDDYVYLKRLTIYLQCIQTVHPDVKINDNVCIFWGERLPLVKRKNKAFIVGVTTYIAQILIQGR